jgi:hypothetical protein
MRGPDVALVIDEEELLRRHRWSHDGSGARQPDVSGRQERSAGDGEQDRRDPTLQPQQPLGSLQPGQDLL